jgi:hypothetical protein
MHSWLPIIIARIISIIQASTLRDRYYTLLNRNEILETALEDIARIQSSDTDPAQKARLIAGIIANTQKL